MKKINIREVRITVLITVVSFCLAVLAAKLDLIPLSYTLFILIPVCTGFFIGRRPTWRMNFMVAIVFAVVAFLALLIASGLEVFACVIMASPLIVLGTVIGTGIGYFIRQQWDDNDEKKNRNIKLSILPLAVVLFASTVEHYFVDKYNYVKVSTSIYLPYSPAKVYDYIKSVDTLNTTKPFFMQLGLPVPQKCVLKDEKVGAMRTCYFEDGVIEEKVTAIKPGELLKMDVTRVTVPLPAWLTFEEAIYQFEPKDSGTVITRITTYKTELKPRFYWRYFETKAIEAEHEYVLDDLKHRLEKSGQ
jgi:hypothetical protein